MVLHLAGFAGRELPSLVPLQRFQGAPTVRIGGIEVDVRLDPGRFKRVFGAGGQRRNTVRRDAEEPRDFAGPELLNLCIPEGSLPPRCQSGKCRARRLEIERGCCIGPRFGEPREPLKIINRVFGGAQLIHRNRLDGLVQVGAKRSGGTPAFADEFVNAQVGLLDEFFGVEARCKAVGGGEACWPVSFPQIGEWAGVTLTAGAEDVLVGRGRPVAIKHVGVPSSLGLLLIPCAACARSPRTNARASSVRVNHVDRADPRRL